MARQNLVEKIVGNQTFGGLLVKNLPKKIK